MHPQNRFVALCKQIFGCITRSVDCQMPGIAWQSGRQTEIDCLCAGIEHQKKQALSLLVNQAGKLFFLRIDPGWQASLRAEPLDFCFRIELLLAEIASFGVLMLLLIL